MFALLAWITERLLCASIFIRSLSSCNWTNCPSISMSANSIIFVWCPSISVCHIQCVRASMRLCSLRMELIGKFTDGHYKTSILVRQQLGINQNPCAENLESITIEPRDCFFSDIFCEEIKLQIDGSSLESLKAQSIESTNVQSAVSKCLRFFGVGSLLWFSFVLRVAFKCILFHHSFASFHSRLRNFWLIFFPFPSPFFSLRVHFRWPGYEGTIKAISSREHSCSTNDSKHIISKWISRIRNDRSKCNVWHLVDA